MDAVCTWGEKFASSEVGARKGGGNGDADDILPDDSTFGAGGGKSADIPDADAILPNDEEVENENGALDTCEKVEKETAAGVEAGCCPMLGTTPGRPGTPPVDIWGSRSAAIDCLMCTVLSRSVANSATLL